MIKILLHSYLLQHKSLSIPGLGAIYVERIPAQSDFVNKQLLPPAYHFRFNKYSDAPGKDFFAWLALQEKVTDYDAIKMYNEWAMDFRNKIDEGQPAGWKGVGSLVRNSSGEIIFEPETSLNAFLEPVPAERIIRNNIHHMMLVGDRERSSDEMTGFLNEDPPVKKIRWWFWILIVVAIAAIIFFILFYQTGFALASAGNGHSF